MNQKNFPKGLIICGTDTDVGKTIISCMFVQGLNAQYWKPIQSGNEDGTDSDVIRRILNLQNSSIFSEVYSFKAPVSPHWAAEKESSLINTYLLTPPSTKKFLIIETAGGLMVPLNRESLQIDQLEKWSLPIVLVARSGLGTLNHTLLSLEALKRRNLPVLGIVLNGPPHKDNPTTLEEFGGIPIIAEVPNLSIINAQSLDEIWKKEQIDAKLNNRIIQLYKDHTKD